MDLRLWDKMRERERLSETSSLKLVCEVVCIEGGSRWGHVTRSLGT